MCHGNLKLYHPMVILDKLYTLMCMYINIYKIGVTRIMHNSPNRGVNYHIFQNKGNYPVIPIYGYNLEK